MHAAADRVEQVAARIGTVLDARWTIDSVLGIGGMAAVYGASAGDERVAIKVLHPELTRSHRALERFRREGDMLRTVTHRAVPRIHGEGTTADGCPYLAMDLLLGETVEARRRRFGGRLAWAEVVEIALAVLDVLEAVHARGLIHRDIKPSNLLWLDDGTVRLIDFGIAKPPQDEEDIALTRTGELPGSLPFMAPEHALGVPTDLDARSDLWSLGATMFLLLSGRPVHESQTDVGALALAASKPARSLGSVVSGLPPALVAAVDRALAFERRERFADAAEMRSALRLPGTPLARARSRRWPYVTVAIALLLAGGGLAFIREPHVDAPPRMAPVVAPVLRAPEPSAVAAPEPPAEPPPPVEPPRPVVRAARRESAAPLAPPVSSASTVGSARCDPPFVIDPATGTRRVKPGC